jgi:putative membrane protein
MHLTQIVPLLTETAGYHWAHDGGWWPWAPAFFGFWILLLAAIAVTAWLITRRGTRQQAVATEPSGVERARGILAERFARGEISAEEYDNRLSHLQ